MPAHVELRALRRLKRDQEPPSPFVFTSERGALHHCGHIGMRSGQQSVLLEKNFTSQSFHADVSECKRQNPSFVAIQSYVADSQDRTSNIDDAMVRDCMKAKGYDIRVQTK